MYTISGGAWPLKFYDDGEDLCRPHPRCPNCGDIVIILTFNPKSLAEECGCEKRKAVERERHAREQAAREQAAREELQRQQELRRRQELQRQQEEFRRRQELQRQQELRQQQKAAEAKAAEAKAATDAVNAALDSLESLLL